MKVYIAGPMRKYSLYNFPAFDRAAAGFRDLACEVISPADLDRAIGFDPVDLPEDFDWDTIPDGFDVDACLQRDINALRQCDVIYLLDGWKDSTGSKMERAVAEFLQLDIFEQGAEGDPLAKTFFETIAELDEILDEANTLVDSGPLPTDSAERKTYPVYTGFMRYFPRAIAAVAHHSYINNEKHNPGEPLHWSKENSSDHMDCTGRHMLEEDSVSIAWRAMANLEIELEGKAAAIVKAVRADQTCSTCRHRRSAEANDKTCSMCPGFERWEPEQL